MSRSRLVIEVSASRLEAAVVRGRRIVSWRSLRHRCPEWEEKWPASLSSLRQPLADLVRELDASGLRAEVLAGTPTGAVLVNSTPASAGSSAARSATTLALGGVASYPVAENLSATMPLACDRKRHEAGAPRGRQTLGIAESDDTVAAMARWVEEAGLRFDGALPLESVGTLAAVRESTAAAGDGDYRACLWLGEHQSVLAVGTHRHLRFARLVALGIEALAEALTRPISRRGSEGDVPTLTIEEARSLLMRCGIPDASTVIDDRRNLTGAAVLPLIQPVLQRLALEVKQSLRFGLSEAERAGVEVRLMGAGRLVPRLESFLSRHLAAAENREPAMHEQQAPAPACDEYVSALSGSIAEFVSSGTVLERMVPVERARASMMRRARWSLRAGVAACFAMVAAEGAVSWMELREFRALTEHKEGQEINPMDSAALSGALDRASALESQVRLRLGEPLALDAMLAVVSQAATDRVLLDTISFGIAESAPTLSLRGIAVGTSSAQSPINLRGFLDAVSQCPLVQEARLKHSQRSQHGEREVHSFEIAVTLVPPAAFDSGAAAQASAMPADTEGALP